MNTSDRDNRPQPAPRRRGQRWTRRSGSRLQNEGRRDSREQHRGSRASMRLSPRELEDGLEDGLVKTPLRKERQTNEHPYRDG